MKSSSDVIEAVRQYVEYSLDRPQMYAANPTSLEEILRMCDGLIEFILSGRDLLSPNFEYNAFQEKNGHGTALFVNRMAEQGVSEPEIFMRLAEYWKTYLSTRPWWKQIQVSKDS